MSTPNPRRNSGAPYIIICSRRTLVLAAKTIVEKICHASECAAELVGHMAIVHKLKPEDTLEISDLQHYLMDNLTKLNKREAQAKIDEMFRLCYELEEKYEDEY